MIDENTQQIAGDIVANGAILRVRNGSAYVNCLVGYFEWLDDSHVFHFEANGENEFAGHVLKFETAEAPHDLGVEFHGDGGIAAYLSPIDEAGLENEANYIAAWRAWQMVLSQRGESIMEFIRETRDQLIG